MLRVVCIGDPHFKADNVVKMQMFMDLTEKWCIEKKPDAIICLGDILHTHRTIHVKPLQMATEFLHRMIKIAKTYLLIGNHDRPDNSHFLTTEHAFNAFKSVSGITIVDQGMVDNIKGFNIAFIPYVPPGRFKEAYDIVAKGKCIDLIMAHQEFKGCKLNALTGTTSTIGDIWSEKMPPVFSGHIHNRHSFGNIFYVGTPVQENRSEDPDKGIHLIEITRKEDIEDDESLEGSEEDKEKEIKREKEIKKIKENEEIKKIKENFKNAEFKLSKSKPEGKASSSKNRKENEEETEPIEVSKIKIEKLEDPIEPEYSKGNIDIELEYYRLPIPPEVQVTITVEELPEFVPPEGTVTLIIEGTAAEIKSLRGSSFIKKLKKKKVKILTKTIGIEMGKIQHKNKAFMDIVYASLTKSNVEYLQRLIEENA